MRTSLAILSLAVSLASSGLHALDVEPANEQRVENAAKTLAPPCRSSETVMVPRGALDHMIARIDTVPGNNRWMSELRKQIGKQAGVLSVWGPEWRDMVAEYDKISKAVPDAECGAVCPCGALCDCDECPNDCPHDCAASANPVTPIKKKDEPKEKSPYPDVTMKSNWGEVSQKGPGVSIGGEHWTAGGEWRKDGKLDLNWFQPSTGRHALGLYEFKDGQLFGHWNWDNLCEFDINGDLVPFAGESIYCDRIYKVEAPKVESPK